MLIMTLYSTLSDVVYGVCIINFEQISQTKNKFVNVVSFISKKNNESVKLTWNFICNSGVNTFLTFVELS